MLVDLGACSLRFRRPGRIVEHFALTAGVHARHPHPVVQRPQVAAHALAILRRLLLAFLFGSSPGEASVPAGPCADSPTRLADPRLGVRLVDDDGLAAMDRLEQVDEPGWYHRERIVVKPRDGGPQADAWVYFGSAGRADTEQRHAGPLAEYTLDHQALYRGRDA